MTKVGYAGAGRSVFGNRCPHSPPRQPADPREEGGGGEDRELEGDEADQDMALAVVGLVDVRGMSQVD